MLKHIGKTSPGAGGVHPRLPACALHGLEQLEARLLLSGAPSVWPAAQATVLLPDTGDDTVAYEPSGDEISPASLPTSWNGVLDVYVEDGLLAGIQSSIDTYVADLTGEGYSVSVQEFTGSALDLRTQLQSRHTSAGLEGALLIGDLPTLMFTNDNDFSSSETFIHDLYFMDLDGQYVLSDTEPDEHFHGSGDVDPEIYVSRITPSGITGLTGRSETQLINDYFDRVHRYRTGDLYYADRAVIWSDDDWSWGVSNLGSLYSDRTAINDDAETTVDSYISTVTDNYETMLEMVHANVTFQQVHGTGGGMVEYHDIYQHNPRVGFLNMWNCSSATFTATNNLIATYMYSGDYLLNAVGSTKTGSMLSTSSFYNDQAAGYTLGQAFAREMQRNAAETSTDGSSVSDVNWYYGMTMQGDPTLRPDLWGGYSGDPVPVGVDDVFTTAIDTSIAMDLVANDTDPGGDPLKVIRYSDPSSGSLSRNLDGTLQYTPASGFVGEDTFTYTVGDGRGGEDIAAVTVTVDNGGPAVTDHSPSGNISGMQSYVLFTFDEAMDTTSFDLATDVISFAGPGGSDLSGQITGYEWNGSRTLRVSFAAQSELGAYSLTIGPDIFDLGGEAMDQDDDGQSGEAVADRYTATFTIVNAAPTVTIDSPVGASVNMPTLGTMLLLEATVTDDGLGSGELSQSWSVLDKPSGSAVTFEDAAAADTAVSFSQTGDYTLVLTATDGDASASAQVSVSFDAASENTAAEVTATYSGGLAGNPVSLDGHVVDDGLVQQVATTWQLIDGPGSVSFGDATAEDTTATVDQLDGVYTFRLIADDGQANTAADVVVQVARAGDLDLDGHVSFLEIARVISNLGRTSADWSTGDVFGDGVVDLADADAAMAAFVDQQTPVAPVSVAPDPGRLDADPIARRGQSAAGHLDLGSDRAALQARRIVRDAGPQQGGPVVIRPGIEAATPAAAQPDSPVPFYQATMPADVAAGRGRLPIEINDTTVDVLDMLAADLIPLT